MQHGLKAAARTLGPFTLVLFLTGWWMTRRSWRWWARTPGVWHCRLGPVQLTWWRGKR